MTYGKSVTISRNVAYQRNRNTVSLRAERTGFGPVANIVVIVLILCLLGLVYLTQVTKTNSLGYELSSVQTESQELTEEYASLELEAVRLQNLERIKNSNVAQGLQEVSPTAYVTE
jgi:cell division protein FtsL